ncbi:MAG: prephenate dehydrogenase/arogenate dehydrogenase family protein [Gammaproteobacteria bacterium]|nr:prephenate dehydrogenase/arogenate dehydrogenase family protein [Gammaproteobacteria bacterium]
MIQRLAIIGVGLIGGSLAAALRQRGLVREVVGCGRDARNLQQGVAMGVLDHYTHDAAEAAAGADMVVVAVTLGATRGILERIAPVLHPASIVTDVGSTKAGVVAAAREALDKHFPHFVPGHPIAGGERSGVEASNPDLYERHRIILTPVEETAPAALTAVRDMWAATGAEVVDMSPLHHDEILAATSHLPHMLAYALVDCLAGLGDGEGAILDYAAGGFRDFTRIASSNPEMWRDIALENREALEGLCARFETTFHDLRLAIARGDGPAMEALFTHAKQVRDAYLKRIGRP